MQDSLLEIGKITNTHALKGEIKIMPWCDDPEIFKELDYLLINDKEYEIERSRIHKGMVIIKLFDVDSINDAELLKNSVVYVERNQLGELPPGVYYIKDLLGSNVETEDGKFLGVIEEVIKTGSNDVYQLNKTKSGKPILIPVLPETIVNVDVSDKLVKVKLLKGLVDENEI